MYGVGSPGFDSPGGVDDADLTFDLDLLKETRHRTEQAAPSPTVPEDNKTILRIFYDDELIKNVEIHVNVK